MDANRIKELKKEYKVAKAALDRAVNPEQGAKATNRLTIILTKLEQLNVILIETGSLKRVRVKNHTWTYEQVLLAYAIYRYHGHSSEMSRLVSRDQGDSEGMGADSMHMKVSAFWSHLESDGSWSLCETGKIIANKFKDLDKMAVETLTGRIVAF